MAEQTAELAEIMKTLDTLQSRVQELTTEEPLAAPGVESSPKDTPKAVKKSAPELPPDVRDHVLRADIESVIAIGIKGLQPLPDGTFKPDANTTRAEFAMIVEDILIKITGEEKLATMFIGNQSPFPDLRNDLPYFNAVMVCTSRGIMEAVDLGTGEFQPSAVISGADALLSIRALKTQLSKY